MPFFECEFTAIVHVEADDSDDALVRAEPFARQQAADGAWSQYDDCVREITRREF